MKDDELLRLITNEEQLNELTMGSLSGNQRGQQRWGLGRLKSEQIGVLARKLNNSTTIQPLALIVHKEAQRRLFGRFSSLRSEFSPLTAWCHVFDVRLAEAFEETKREPWLAGFEASWSGLIVAEAVLLTGRQSSSLKVAGCYATASYAVARTLALWPRISAMEVLEKYEASNRLIRGTELSVMKLAKHLVPIWGALSEAGTESAAPSRRIIGAIIALRNSRENGLVDEHLKILNALGGGDEFEFLAQFDLMGPEERVQLFDYLINSLRSDRIGEEQQEVLTFLAAYVATVAAGGQSSIGIAEKVSNKWPEILAWAYVIGGIGQRVTWTSSFSGLGRLVWRELMRPFHMDETPNCDFAFDEAIIVTDRQLSDPFVHLNIKQQRLVSVALFPGVNVSIPLSDQYDTTAPNKARKITEKTGSETEKLFEALWPMIENRLQLEGYNVGPKTTRSSSKGRKSSQGHLKLEK